MHPDKLEEQVKKEWDNFEYPTHFKKENLIKTLQARVCLPIASLLCRGNCSLLKFLLVTSSLFFRVLLCIRVYISR